MKKNSKCKGCGVTLQTVDENKLGYVKTLENMDFCKRCFQLKNYGINKIKVLEKDFFKKEVSKTLKISDLVLVVVDIFDFNTSLNDEILDVIKEKHSILIVNKLDLLPNSVSKTHLSNWIRETLRQEDTYVLDIAYISAKSVTGIKGIFKRINTFILNNKKNNKKDFNICVIGTSNTGKSSVINTLLKEINIKTLNLTSKYTGTTIESIHINFKLNNNNICLIDTPGLIPEGRMTDMFDEETALKLIPQNKLIAESVKIKSKDVLFLTKYIQLESLTQKIIKDNEHSLVLNIYKSPFVKIHRTNKQKSFEILKKDILNISKNEQFKNTEFIETIFNISKDEDLFISGLMFIEFSFNSTVKLRYPKGLKIIVRPRMLRMKK